jgi:hypothetical protein
VTTLQPIQMNVRKEAPHTSFFQASVGSMFKELVTKVNPALSNTCAYRKPICLIHSL